jgi:hypothetical protein
MDKKKLHEIKEIAQLENKIKKSLRNEGSGFKSYQKIADSYKELEDRVNKLIDEDFMKMRKDVSVDTLFWFVIVLIVLCLYFGPKIGYDMGVMQEKVGDLEDVVFNSQTQLIGVKDAKR